MLQQTRGIVLRAVKYGETSLICTVFTEVYGVQSYMIQGVRTAGKKKQSRAGLFQPASILDLTIYYNPNANLQRIKEFNAAYLYTTLQEHVVKNSVALFSVELLLRLLPEHAPLPELFESVLEYFDALDKTTAPGNFPVFFLVHCSDMLGYSITGDYNITTPYLNLHEGGFSEHMPKDGVPVTDEDARMLGKMIQTSNVDAAALIQMNGAMRFRLLDWLLAFLHNHTQHMGEIKSLPVLRAVLH